MPRSTRTERDEQRQASLAGRKNGRRKYLNPKVIQILECCVRKCSTEYCNRCRDRKQHLEKSSYAATGLGLFVGLVGAGRCTRQHSNLRCATYRGPLSSIKTGRGLSPPSH